MAELHTIREVSGLKILIAENDDPSDLLITIALEKIRLEFLHAKTGIEAVDACLSNLEIDLVLMDFRIPEVDGYKATRQIRQFNKNLINIDKQRMPFVATLKRQLKPVETIIFQNRLKMMS
jgi:CheY-like chemotaxis protein